MSELQNRKLWRLCNDFNVLFKFSSFSKKKHTAQNYSTRCKKYENRLELHYITKGRKCQYKLQKIVIYFWKGAKQWIHQY